MESVEVVLWKLGPRVHTEHVLITVSCLPPFPAEEDAGVSYEPGGKACTQASATQKEGLSCLWPAGLLLDLAFRQLARHVLTLLPAQTVGLWSFPPSPDCSPCWAL